MNVSLKEQFLYAISNIGCVLSELYYMEEFSESYSQLSTYVIEIPLNEGLSFFSHHEASFQFYSGMVQSSI